MKLFYRRFGTGTPLAVLHGLFGMSDFWIPIAKALSKDFQVIIPDLRNHGRSPHHPEMSCAAMENDILALIDELNFSKIRLLGHSMGGKLAMSFALNHPERVESLIVADIGVKASAISGAMREVVEIFQSVDIETFSSRSELSSRLDCSSQTREIILKNIQKTRDGKLAWKPNVEAILQNLPKISASISGDKTFHGTALLLKGERSEYITPEDIPDIQKRFPNSRFSVVPTAGHWLHVDNREAFLKEVLGFLDAY